MTIHHGYKVHGNGNITIPAEIRRSLDLRKGDVIILEETEDGLLLTPLHYLAQINPEQARAFIDEHQLSPDEIASRP